MNFNFSDIRPLDGSQNNGFEELVSQLAHLQKPDNGHTFVRKEGAGGDAGIECYWILDDGAEIGWQAKYFLGEMDSSRWGQLDDSFETALVKHPRLTKYIVSLPIDKTDSRKMGRGGKKIVSVEDEWNNRLKKWRKLAIEKGRNIEFEYWGKHEIISFLMIDDTRYSGRALYWFNEPILGFDVFNSIAQKSKVSLGERYTPDFHVELPITRSIEALATTHEWWNRVSKEKCELIDRCNTFFNKILEHNDPLLNKDKIKGLETLSERIVNLIHGSIKNRNLLDHVEEIKRLCDYLQKYRDSVEQEEYFKRGKEDSDRRTVHSIDKSDIRKFFSAYKTFSRFLNSYLVKTAIAKAALLHGEAGIGKSHLLCDISLNRLSNGFPTVFLLGQHYEGGNPLNFLKSSLDLQGYRNKQVLGALDAAGEAYRSKSMIVIDAINEGLYRDDWQNHIRDFLAEISIYRNICVLISCRTSYLKYMIPESVGENCIIKIQHVGFQGFEHRAAEKYMSMQGISKPSAPILSPEFTNPLFLKTCCQALKHSGLCSFPKGIHGLTSLFDFYIQSVEKIISNAKRYTPEEEIVRSIVIDIASQVFPKNFSGIPKTEARRAVNALDPNPNHGRSLFDELIHEGVLAEDISYREGKGQPVIRFTYERFSDHFIAQQLIKKYDDKSIMEIMVDGGPLSKILNEGGIYRYEGIFEALSIVLAEKFHIELVDLFVHVDERVVDNWVINRIFSETVVWRSPDSFTDRTLEILNNLETYEFSSPVIEILLKLSTEPNHPWNADLLHRNLVNKTVAERDHFWSTHIALADSFEADGQTESIVRTLIEWSCFGDLRDIDIERARLCAITLLWFLTTPNRRIRDQATKSIVRLISVHPNLLLNLLNQFYDINDLYLVERLYAVVYGVICTVNDDSIITQVASTIYALVFKENRPIPHILLRDYARGVLEYAQHLELLSKDIKPIKYRPPYNSEWPIKNPSGRRLSHPSRLPHNPACGFPALGCSTIGLQLADVLERKMSILHSTPLQSVRSQNTVELLPV